MLSIQVSTGNWKNENHETVDPNSWLSDRALWDYTPEGLLRTWDMAQQVWWYVQSGTLRLIRDAGEAARVEIKTAVSGNRQLIQDMTTMYYLDWASAYPPSPNDVARTGAHGFAWVPTLYPDSEDSWHIFRPASGSHDNFIVCDPSARTSYPMARPGFTTTEILTSFGPINGAGLKTGLSGGNLLNVAFWPPPTTGVFRYVFTPANRAPEEALALRIDLAATEIIPVQFSNNSQGVNVYTPKRRFVLNFDAETNEVFYEPNSMATTRYSLAVPVGFKTKLYTASNPVKLEFVLTQCDRYDPTLPASGCPQISKVVTKDRYQRFRIVTDRDPGAPGASYVIQDIETALVVLPEDLTMVSAFGTANVKMTRVKLPENMPLREGELLEELFHVPTTQPEQFTRYPVAICNNSVPVTSTPLEKDRADCCSAKHLTINAASPSILDPTDKAFTYIDIGLSATGESFITLENTGNGSIILDPITEADNIWVSCAEQGGMVYYRRILEGRLLRTLNGYFWVGLAAPALSGLVLEQLPQLGPGFGLIGGYQEADLLKLEITNHGAICGTDWCPFGNGCRGYAEQPGSDMEQLQDYCAVPDDNGLPRFRSNENCRRWCELDPGKISLSSRCIVDSAEAFCRDNPDSPQCLCHNYTETPAFQRIRDSFLSVPGCDVCEVIPAPVCWAAPCTVGGFGPDAPVFTAEMMRLSANCSVELTFCNQIIEIVGVEGNVNVSDNDFYQVCGQHLPTPGSLGTGTDNQSAWIGDHPGEFAAMLIGIIILVAIIAWLVYSVVAQGRKTKNSPLPTVRN
jgi:hypothetical protein